MGLQVVTGALGREQILKVAYSAWIRGDGAALTAMFCDDCEFHIVGNTVLNPHSGLRAGIAGLRESMRLFHASFIVREVLIEKIIAKDDDAVVHWHSSLEYVPTGRIIESERCDLIAFRGDQICKISCFFDSASMAVATGRVQLPVPDAAAGDVARKA